MPGLVPRVAVLAGGGGSNLQALIDAQSPAYEIALVISHVPNVRALERARLAGIPALVVDHRAFEDRAAFDGQIDAHLREHKIDLVCLAGFMRILGAEIVDAWQGRMLNIHPSLLPAFKGLNTHQRALDAGVAIHGCSVHLVSAELDDGPILVQAAVPVRHGDSAETLAARVLTMEHRSYPLALEALAQKTAAGAGPQSPRLLIDQAMFEGLAGDLEA